MTILLIKTQKIKKKKIQIFSQSTNNIVGPSRQQLIHIFNIVHIVIVNINASIPADSDYKFVIVNLRINDVTYFEIVRFVKRFETVTVVEVPNFAHAITRSCDQAASGLVKCHARYRGVRV